MRAQFVVAIGLWCAIPTVSRGQPAPDDGLSVYDRVLKSMAWIHSPRAPGKVAWGSGSLVDLKHRLVLTNFHVVGDVDRVNVYFPSYDRGRAIAERSYYVDNATRLAWKGRVVARDPLHDLALIQLDSLPNNVAALPLAAKPVTPGQSVHSIGNPGSSGALWVYTPGRVRQVYFKKWQADVDGRPTNFEAEVIETDSPTNPGDSGGPLVNDRGQLVGVTQGGAKQANLLSTFIELSDVRKFLTSSRVLNATGFKIDERTVALPSTDEGKFFSPETMKQVNEAAKKLFEKTGKDLVIQTFASVPAGKTDEVKAMISAERAKFFESWAKTRIRDLGVHGIYVLICKEPSSLRIEVSDFQLTRLTKEQIETLTADLLKKFREKQFDEGLRQFVSSATELLSK